MKRRCFGSCLLLAATASAFGPIHPESINNGRAARIRRNKVALQSSSDDEIPSTRTNSAFSVNEFSRILHVDRIFQNRRRSANSPNQQREHDVKIEANADECKALAKRFDLKGLTKLEAELTFRAATGALAEASGARGSLPVEAEGVIEASLIQKCVRTNEEFEMEVEFPVYTMIKPVASNNNEDLRMLYEKEQEEETAFEASGKKKKKKQKNKKNSRRKDVFHENKQVHNLSDVFDLQAAIQEADFFGGDDGGADLVEDEAIYSLSSEQLDVGELIAQAFYLQLDPFPKKPGSDPVEWVYGE